MTTHLAQADAVIRALGRCDQAAKDLDKCRREAGYEAGYFCRDYVVQNQNAVEEFAVALKEFVAGVTAGAGVEE